MAWSPDPHGVESRSSQDHHTLARHAWHLYCPNFIIVVVVLLFSPPLEVASNSLRSCCCRVPVAFGPTVARRVPPLRLHSVRHDISFWQEVDAVSPPSAASKFSPPPLEVLLPHSPSLALHSSNSWATMAPGAQLPVSSGRGIRCSLRGRHGDAGGWRWKWWS